MAAAPTLGPINAVEAMTPAFERTKRRLFQPFRFSHWWRLALTALLAGEMGSGGNWGNAGDWRTPEHKSKDFFLLAAPTWADWHDFLPVIIAGVVSLLLLLVIFMYISSVFRFILFDSVLRERVHIREGWRRWQEPGGRFFLWQIGFSAVTIALGGLLIGLPLLYAWRSGLFKNPGEHFGALILGGVLMVFLGIVWVFSAALVGVFTKDFVVPLMALEDLSAMDAWRRLLPMLRAEKGSFAGYIGMKIVLAIGAGILFGILSLFALVVALIPLVILGIVVAALVAALGLTWNLLTIILAVLLGAVLLFGLFWLMTLVSVPSVVFFQFYTLHFFGSRYARLGAILTPPAPPPPPSAALPVPA